MCPLECIETIVAHGHENILATHKSTVEITKEADLSKTGDCIIGVSANKATNDLSTEFTKLLRDKNARLDVFVEAGGVAETISAAGDSGLILTHPTSIVLRKSCYVCARTLAIRADKSAGDLSRKLVEKLRNPYEEVRITLVVRV